MYDILFLQTCKLRSKKYKASFHVHNHSYNAQVARIGSNIISEAYLLQKSLSNTVRFHHISSNTAITGNILLFIKTY